MMLCGGLVSCLVYEIGIMLSIQAYCAEYDEQWAPEVEYVLFIC
jgi:hypothetical protein